MIDQHLLAQFSLLPDELKKEALDFMGYLLQKYSQKIAEAPQKDALMELLLKGPTASDEELSNFEKNKEWMNQWKIA